MKTIRNIIHQKSALCIRDRKGNELYYENSSEFWYICEYDDQDNAIYYENSEGYVADNRS